MLCFALLSNLCAWATIILVEQRLKSWLFSLLPCYGRPLLPSHWAGTAGTVAVRLGRRAVTKWDSLLATWRFCHRNNAVKVLISMKVLISKLAVTSNVRVSLFFCQEITVHWNHISHSLRSKRFRFSVSEQRKIEERDSRFWPREKWNESQKARKRLLRRLHFLWWATGTLPSDH